MHGHLGGLPPRVDLAAEKSLAALLHEGVGLLTSAHDVSDGGLAQTLAESALANMCGVRVDLAAVAGGDPFLALFAESAGRAGVNVAHADPPAQLELAPPHGVPVDDLVVEGAFEVNLLQLRSAWTATLPAALAADLAAVAATL